MLPTNRHSSEAPVTAAKGDGLARDLSVVLLLKILLLFVLWFAFFHHPDTPALTPQAVQHQLLGAAAGASGHSPAPQETD